MKRLRIAVLIDQLVPGGVQKSAINEALEIKKLGHDATLFVLVKLKYPYQYNDLTKGLKVVYLSDFNPTFFKTPWRIPYFSFLTSLHLLNPFFAARYKILKKYDFMISHGTTTCITAAAISKKFRLNYAAFIWDPMLYILEKVYGNTPLKYIFPVLKIIIQIYERSFLLSAAIVATSSKVHKEFIKNRYQIDPIIIYPGCAVPKPAPKTKDMYLLGYTRWETAKNPSMFLELARLLPKVKFLIAGSWTKKEEELRFRQTILREKLDKRILLFPEVNYKQLAIIASKSLAWIHPHIEAFGMSGLEMAALELPLVIPKGSGITELFIDGKHGFFPRKLSASAYIAGIQYLLKNTTKAELMGKNAAKVAKELTWKNHAITIVKAITQYVSQTNVLVLNTAFVSTNSLGGGDQFIIELARRKPTNIHLTIVTPQIGFYHWKNAHIFSQSIRFLVLPHTFLDNIESPLPIFLAYVARIFFSLLIIHQLPKFSSIHSSTDVISDVVPAFFVRISSKSVKWTARFFHFIEYPLKRSGTLWVNLGSFSLQRISLRLLQFADTILTDNPHITQKLLTLGFLQSRIEVHPGGANLLPHQSTLSRTVNPAFYSDALVVGRLQAHKGVFDTLDVWKNVTEKVKKAQLTLVGHTTNETLRKLKVRITDLQLSKNVRITGFVSSRNSLLKYFQNTKLLLFLDHEAGFGLAVAEAFELGLPVVAYDLPIFGELYKAGYLTAPLQDTDKVANHVVNLLINPGLRHNLAMLAKREALKFDWNSKAKNFFRSIR